MSDSFLPPLVATLSADIAGFMEDFSSARTMTVDFKDSVGELGAAVDEVFAGMGETIEDWAVSVDSSAALASAGFKTILDSVVDLGEGTIEPLGEVKTSLSGVGTAVRALAKATTGLDAAAAEGFKGVTAAAAEMATGLDEAMTSAKASIAGLDAEFGTAATTAGSAAADIAASSTAAAAAATEAGGAAAASAEESTAALGGTAGAMSKFVIGLAALGVGIFEITKETTSFQTAMTQLQTQAGLTNAELQQSGMTAAQLDTKVLNLGSQVGETGTEMAQALYHPISAGLDLQTALLAVTDAAKESKISGSDLEDTTYSLSSVMKAFNYSAAETTPTMAALNAIVGNGDMHFQDLNDSIKSWAPSAATFGVSLNSIGAGLDYMTDRGDTAATAGTKLSMMMALMVGQSKQAAGIMVTLGLNSTQVTASSKAMSEAFEKSGVTQGKMASDLKQPDGLYVALSDLKTHLQAAGLSATETDSLLVKAFGGGKNFKGVTELLDNLDGLKQKFNQLQQGGSVAQWQQDWTKASNTLSVQFDQLKASLANMGIKIGAVLLPPLTKFLGWVKDGVQWISNHKAALYALGLTIAAVLVPAIYAAGAALVTFITSVEIAGAPVILIALAIAGLIYAGYELAKHWGTIWGEVKRISTDVGHFVEHVFDDVAGWFAGVWRGALGALKTAWHGIEDAWNDTGGKAVSWIAKTWDKLTEPIVKEWDHIIGDLESIWGSLTEIWNDSGGQLVSLISSNMSSIEGFFKAVWNRILDVLKVEWTLISGFLKAGFSVVSGIVKAGWDIVQGIFHMAWDIISGVVMAAWDIIAGITKAGFAVLTAVFEAAWDVIKGTVMVAWDLVTGIINTALDYITGLIKIFADLVTGQWGKLWGDVKSLFTTVWNDIKSLFTGVLGEIGHTMASAGTALWHGFTGAITSALGGIEGALKSVWNAVVNFFSDAGTWLWNAGANIIKGLIGGVSSMIGGIGGAMSDIVSEVKHFLPWSPAKKGPLSGSGSPQIGGRNIVKQIATGLMSGTADITNAMAHVTGAAAGSLAVRVPAMAGAGGGGYGSQGGGGSAPVTVNLTVQGTVVSENQLRDTIQTQFLQLAARNSKSWAPYRR